MIKKRDSASEPLDPISLLCVSCRFCGDVNPDPIYDLDTNSFYCSEVCHLFDKLETLREFYDKRD